MNLFLLDDSRSFIDGFEEMFREIDDKGILHVARDLDVAFDQLFKENKLSEIDIFCIDYYLGNDTFGTELIKETRKRGWEGPIILLTGAEDTQIAFEAGQINATEFYNKENLIKSSELNRIIQDALSKNAKIKEQLRFRAEQSYKGLINLVREFRHDTKDTFIPIIHSAENSKDLICEIRKNVLKNANEVDAEFDLLTDEIDEIMNLAEKGENYLSHLNDFVETGKLVLDPQYVDIKKFIDRCVGDYLHKDREIELSISVRSAHIDENVLERIIRAVLVNIENHLPLNVKTDIKVFSTSVNSTIHFVNFNIRDYGYGIPENIRFDIFEPGVIGNHTLKKNGSGLGLTIAKKLTEAHVMEDVRGTILCEVPGDMIGTVFIIKIPTVQVEDYE